MAEAIAAVGVAASIVQIVDFSAKVAKRLKELDSTIENAPIAFHDLQIQLELLRSNLDTIRERYSDRGIDSKTQSIIDAVVQGCLRQTQRADEILNKIRPLEGDSRLRRGIKALLSVTQENDIKDVIRSLVEYIQHLQFYETLNLSPVLPTRPVPSRSNSFRSVPFEKDEFFAGREAQIQKLREFFQTSKRAALYGLGGVGKSQIAIEYGHQFLQDKPGAIVLWIYANSIARIDEAYKEIADKAGLAGAEDPSVSKYELVSKLAFRMRYGHYEFL